MNFCTEVALRTRLACRRLTLIDLRKRDENVSSTAAAPHAAAEPGLDFTAAWVASTRRIAVHAADNLTLLRSSLLIAALLVLVLTVMPLPSEFPDSEPLQYGSFITVHPVAPNSSTAVRRGSNLELPRNVALSAWRSRSQPFLNVFLVWNTHRDTWSALQDRVVGSVVATIRGARVRVLSNTLPPTHFHLLNAEGYDVSVMAYDIPALIADMPGRTWYDAATSAPGPHLATHLADFLRLIVLNRYGGLYLDTDALWLRDVRDLPAAFIGKIDFLKLEPECTWCVDGRWYLANGILSFPARHPFLDMLLRKIDATPYDGKSRTAIGPQFMTTALLHADAPVRNAVSLLDEYVLYPIAGPDVPKYFVRESGADAFVRALIARSHSVHAFAFTFGHLGLHPRSVFGTLMRTMWPASREPLCRCTPAAGGAGLCVPASAVIEYQPLANPWFWPSARLCIGYAPPLNSSPHAVRFNVAARNGAIRTWSHEPARELSFVLSGPPWTSDDLASLEYRHVGGYCNDVVTVTVVPVVETAVATQWSAVIPVSAPCLDASSLLAPPPSVRGAPLPPWSALIAEPVASITRADLAARPELAANFSACMRTGSRSALGVSPDTRLRVGLLVSATGSYVSWLDGLVLSAEAHFMRGAEVHYYVLTDVAELPISAPADRVHVLPQPRLGWPYDSMFRHQLYLKHRAAYAGMDFVLVLDADTAFVAPVGEEILGRTVGALQSFFFGQPFERAPFERDATSSSFVPDTKGRCYFAGGLFGGSYEGFVALMTRSTWLMEWDLAALGRTAPHDDESYLNKAFLEEPPAVALGGHYIYPEPPADRAWGLSGVAWTAAFPPHIYNLGARKWLSQMATTDRDYRSGDAATKPLDVLRAPVIEKGGSNADADATPAANSAAVMRAPAAVCVCTPLSGTERQRHEWVRHVAQSVATWHAATAEVVIMDPTPLSGALAATVTAGNTRASYLPFHGAYSGDGDEAVGQHNCPLPALQQLAANVSSRTMLLVDTAAVLTWQSHLSFLQEQVEGAADLQSADGSEIGVLGDAGTIVVTCPRAVSAPTPCSLSGTTGMVQDMPPYSCAACDTVQVEQLERERLGGAVVTEFTPMRKLTCWAADRVVGHASVMLPTALLRKLLVGNWADGAKAEHARCGVDCWLSRALAASQALRKGAAPRLLSCLNDLSSFLRLDPPATISTASAS